MDPLRLIPWWQYNFVIRALWLAPWHFISGRLGAQMVHARAEVPFQDRVHGAESISQLPTRTTEELMVLGANLGTGRHINATPLGHNAIKSGRRDLCISVHD